MAPKPKNKKKTKAGSIISSIGKALKTTGKAFASDVKSLGQTAVKAASAVKNAPLKDRVASAVPGLKAASKVIQAVAPKATQKAVTVAKTQANKVVGKIVNPIKRKANVIASNSQQSFSDIARGALSNVTDTREFGTSQPWVPFPGQAARDAEAEGNKPLSWRMPEEDTSYLGRIQKGVENKIKEIEDRKAKLSSSTAKSMSLAEGGYIDDSGTVQSGSPTATTTTDPNAPLSLDESGFSSAGSTEGSVVTDVAAPVTEPAPETTTTNNQFSETQQPSYSFNTQSLANTQATAGRFQMTLDNMVSDPWKYNSNPQESKQTVLETFSSEFAKDYNTPQEFYESLNSPEQQKNLQGYFAAGGNPAMIASKIQTPVNGILPPQNTADYLAGIQAQNTQAGAMAQAALNPERQMANEEIMRIAGIPEDMKDLYFGSEDQMGILEMEAKQAKAEKKLIERKLLAEENNIRQQAQYEIDKNNADAKIAENEIELKRQQMKTYLTGRLASLGALITSGAAPMALGILEQKYEQQRQELQTKLTFANREIEVKMMKAISDKEIWRDEEIQKINADLSKSEAEVRKDIFKAQQDAQKDIYGIKSSYASQLRNETQQYTTELRTLANNFESSMVKLLSGGMSRAAAQAAIDPKTGAIIFSKVPASVFAPKKSSSDGDKAETKANDVAAAIIDFQTQMDKRGWRGANPDAYRDYKKQLTSLHGASAALELDKKMDELGITVDYGV